MRLDTLRSQAGKDDKNSKMNFLARGKHGRELLETIKVENMINSQDCESQSLIYGLKTPLSLKAPCHLPKFYTVGSFEFT